MGQNQRSRMSIAGANAANPGAMPAAVGTVYFPSAKGLPLVGTSLQIKATWTAGVTGSFALETDFGDDDWRAPPGASVEFTANGNAQPAGTASRAVWNWQYVPGSRYRLAFTTASGTASTLTANASQV